MYNDYNDLISENIENNEFESIAAARFIGLVLNSNHQAERVFACSVYNNIPYCIEETQDSSKFNSNYNFVKRVFGEENCNSNESSWFCNVDSSWNYYGGNYPLQNDEYVRVEVSGGYGCDVSYDGGFYCWSS